MPTQASRAGRSPRPTPTSSGTTAAPTADTGATTPIRPAAKPAVEERRASAAAEPGEDRPREVGAARVTGDERGDGRRTDRGGQLRRPGPPTTRR